MRRNAVLFGTLAVLASAIGFLLRVTELNTLLDRSSMLMDRGAVSVILMAVMAAALLLFALPARKWKPSDLPRTYGPAFRGVGNLTAGAVGFLGLLLGALIGLTRWRQTGHVICAVLSLLAILSGCGWLSLSLDALRRKQDGCTLLAAAMPTVFSVLLLVVFYKTYAPIPALRYNLYPFLALCADVLAMHFLAGFTVERVRPGMTIFFIGAGIVLSVTALPGVEELDYRLYLAAITIQLFSHGIRMLLPREGEPAEPVDDDRRPAPAEGPGTAEQPTPENPEPAPVPEDGPSEAAPACGEAAPNEDPPLS